MGATAVGTGGTIANDQIGAVLPSTGGPGTNLLYLFGIMLTGIAGTGLVMRKKQREPT
jgi:LPXTG-motif cell wall-anchored protein